MCYGYERGGELVGVCAFACPCSEAVRASVFGPEHKHRVTELHRLALLDSEPKCSESALIAASLRLLHADRPDIRGVITFADSTQGHLGTIYQASNALYLGTTGRAIFYLDQDGRLRHPRQCGVNISREEAKARGWRPVRRGAKHRYLLLLGSKSDKRWALRNLRYEPLPYPKRG